MSQSKAMILTCVASTLALACQEAGSIEQQAAKTQAPLLGSFVISGTIASSKGPVSGALVKLTGGETRQAYSDSAGKYSIPGLGSGSYTLAATAGTSCGTSAPTQLNNMSSSITVDLALEGTGCATLTAVVGPTGPTGPAGAAGPAGATGATGAQGVAGPAGATGAVGALGPTGPMGPLGLQGIQGAMGPMGPAGPQGAQGPAGPAGPPGSGGGTPAPACDSMIVLPTDELDYFLKLDNIEGDSQDSKHKNEIDVNHFSWAGICRTDSTAKPQFQPVVVTKYTDRATPVLLKAAASGITIASGLLTVRSRGTNPLEFLKIQMEGISVLGGGDHLTLGYQKITVTEVPRLEDGTGGPAISFGWDLNKNQEL